MRKENIIYVGIDLHKETHTAVMLDCWNQKLGEITIENKPSEFSKLVRKVSRFETEEKRAIYGLENAYGYGRGLAVWLIERVIDQNFYQPSLKKVCFSLGTNMFISIKYGILYCVSNILFALKEYPPVFE